MRVALLHLRNERPALGWFQALLDELNAVAFTTVRELGWHPTLIATAEQPVEHTLAQMEGTDAIVIMGGEDVDPRLYGGLVSYPGSGHHEPLADQAQLESVKLAAREGIPLLGICRGAQIINVAFGGTLMQHLADDGTHRRVVPGSVELVQTHPILSGELAAILDAELPAWCGHHQAIDQVGAGLIPTARTSDGVVEAVVHEDLPITGVQWHPEHSAANRSQLRALLERLELQRNSSGNATRASSN